MWMAWAKRRHENRRMRRDNQYEVPEQNRTAEHHDELGASPDGHPIALNNFEYIQMEEQPSPQQSPRTLARLTSVSTFRMFSFYRAVWWVAACCCLQGTETPCPAGTTSSNSDFTPGCFTPNNPAVTTNTAAVIVPVLCIVFMLLFLGGGLILYKGKRYGHERSVHVSPSPVRRKYSVPTIDE
uniref:Uncharacterized protein n=1 Tax=Branchiostoma floridae TaxID=7739 RepID=C3ZEU2_BRAFL|eukprot:XP_002593237.1 hypothetical protein BRAFLDRAFT_72686 [Branchiostoma floridae]